MSFRDYVEEKFGIPLLYRQTNRGHLKGSAHDET